MSSISYIGNVIDFLDRMQGKDRNPLEVRTIGTNRVRSLTPELSTDRNEIRLRTDTVGKARRALEVKARNELI